jgi:hypothetical protein
VKQTIAISLVINPAFLRIDVPGTAGRLVEPSGLEKGWALELVTAEELVGPSEQKTGWALELVTAEGLVELSGQEMGGTLELAMAVSQE